MDINDFSKLFSSVIYYRGLHYWKDGKVEVQSAKDGVYQAIVHGTHPYTTIVEMDGEHGERIKKSSCNCPYGKDCKHVAALLCEIRDRYKHPEKEHTQTKLPELELQFDGNGGMKDDRKGVAERTEKAVATKKEKVAADKTENKDGKGNAGRLAFGNIEMDERRLFFLCYLAYCDDSAFYISAVKTFFPAIQIPQEEQNEYIKDLLEAGWLCKRPSDMWYGYGRSSVIVYMVTPVRLMYVLYELVANHKDWLRTFETKVHQKSEKVCYLIRIWKALLGEQKEVGNVPDLYHQKYTCISSLMPLLLTQDTEQLQRVVAEEYFYPLFWENFRTSMVTEDVALLEHVGEKLMSIRNTKEEWADLYMYYRMYLFFATGRLLAEIEMAEPSEYYYFTEAVQLLYQNKLDESIQMFQKGLKEQDNLWGLIPIDPIVFLMYVIALGLRRTTKDLKALQKILGKKYEISVQYMSPIFALVNFFESVTQEKDTSCLSPCLKKGYAVPIIQSIASLILRFFWNAKGYEKALREPSWAILQCENSPFVHGEKPSWNYAPLLEKVEMKETWMLELEDIIKSVSKVSENGEGDVRLCYCVNGVTDTVTVREQSRLKTGAWGKGKTVGPVAYARWSGLDSYDKVIHKAAIIDSPFYPRELSVCLNHIVPVLKGTDKLYLMTDTQFEPITIIEEKPFLFTRKEGDMISISSNIPSYATCYKGLWLDRSLPLQWVYYPMSLDKQTLFQRLLALKQIPAKAEPMLKQLVASLQGQIEIHSDVEGSTAIEQVYGQTILTLQVTPSDVEAHLVLRIYPVQGSKHSTFPAMGDKNYFDQMDGKRIEVLRDLDGEARALQQLNDILTEEAHCELFTSKHQEQDITFVDLVQLLQIAPDYSSLFAIEWEEGKRINVSKTDGKKWDIQIKKNHGWFEIEGEVALTENDVVTMSQVLSMLRESGGRFIRLSSDQIITLSDSLRRQLERIESLAQVRGGKVQVPELAMAVSGNMLQGEMELQEPKVLVEMRRRIKESEEMSFAVPDNLNATLREYQVAGYQWMMRLNHWGAGACLADDMGLGKTVQTIALMLAHASEGAQMVVAPASVVANWRKEIEKFAPSLNAIIFNNLPATERQHCLERLHANDVLILTYGLLVTEQEALTAPQWVTVCLDEAHTIKNRETKSSSAAMKLKATNRIILTGTPIQNHLGELWNLMQFINPGLLGSYEHFNDRFVTPISNGFAEQKEQLKRLIAPFTLRRTKKQVVQDLPEKTDIKLSISLSEDEMALYEAMRLETKREIEAATSVNMSVLSSITRLREAACSIALVEKSWVGESSKLEGLLDKLLPVVEQGNSVLIFSQFVSFLKMAKSAIENACDAKILYLDGSTPLKERPRMVDAFQTGEAQVFLISLKAGGLGLNLTSANYVFHLDPWWNPAVEQQATDRAYRIGQDQNVTVYHLISEHTIEEKILRLHKEKQSLADSLLEGTDMSNKLTIKDYLELLS